ncbi:MAG: hypothetical protein R3F55_04915 [Alphaproteobacteria bacterium]
MVYLFGEILVWLIAALVLGAAIAWLWLRMTAGSRSEAQLAPWRGSPCWSASATSCGELGEVRDRATERETQLMVLREDLESAQAKAAALASELERARAEGQPAPSDVVVQQLRIELAATRERMAERELRVSELSAELANCREAYRHLEGLQRAPAAGPPAGAAASDAASAEPDPLTRIKGIGKVLEAKLHALGITRFAQIAAFSPADIDRVNDQLAFKGRIEREEWVEQAKALAAARDADG